MNFKNIVWFIKAISYFVLLRSLGIIITAWKQIGVVIIAEQGENREWRKELALNNMDKEAQSQTKYEEAV